jgi:2-polyprenyl-6-hydroxyphenyl methylase/3-demethylubiquinone-9 3-methyltransferase
LYKVDRTQLTVLRSKIGALYKVLSKVQRAPQSNLRRAHRQSSAASNTLPRVTGSLKRPIPQRMPVGARYTLAQRSNFLPLTALLYDTWRVRSLELLTREDFSLEREFALMLEWLQVQAGQTFLDVGTSTGNYARALGARGASVTAIDISKPMLERAQALTNDAGISFEQANVEALPYPDSSFDGVVVGASLNEFFDTDQALAEMARVLRPEGKLFMMYLRASDTAVGRLIQAPFKLSGVRFPSRDRVAQTLATHGVQRTRAELRRAVTLELYIKTERSSAEAAPLPPLARAPGKPARDVLLSASLEGEKKVAPQNSANINEARSP